MAGRRGNGKGTIGPYRYGFRGQVRITDPTSGTSKRFSVYGKTRTEVRSKLRDTIARTESGQVLSSNVAAAHTLEQGEADKQRPQLPDVDLDQCEAIVLHLADYRTTQAVPTHRKAPHHV